jgi:hypothetical protein
MSIYKPLKPREKGYTFDNVNIFQTPEFKEEVEKIGDARYEPLAP